MSRSILDTGPVVALFDRSDAFHKEMCIFIENYTGLLYTTWPVIVEISFLLDFNKETQSDFMKWIEAGAIRIVNLDFKDISKIRLMMEKYSDVPMDLADASLMLISEKLNLRQIISLDKDFYIYRRSDGNSLDNLISQTLSHRKKKNR